MCGIFGFIKSGAWGEHENSNTLWHRGPDDFKTWESDDVYFSHSRLSIVATENGSQPFIDNKCITIVNGEIYNFYEIKIQLISLGAKFKTNSDCEVVHFGYQLFGLDIFERLQGIFSVAIWDRVEKKLVLVRDPIGVKPLYYWSCGEKFAFSSEIKSFFLELEHGSAEINEQALTEYLFYRYIRSNNTMFKNIFKVLPGEIVTICNGALDKKRFEIRQSIIHPKSAIESQHRLVEILNTAVKDQLLGEANIGVYLSGGIDSSTICALASIYSTKQISSYCVEFDEYLDSSESHYAEQVAFEFGTRHRNIKVSLKDVLSNIFQMAWHYDEPMGDAAVAPTFLVSKLASKDGVKVILAGEGADELFAGYDKYKTMYYQAELNSRHDHVELLNTWRASISVFDLDDLVKLGLNRVDVDYINRSIKYDIPKEKVDGPTLVNTLLRVDQQTMLSENYLMKADKMTAAHGLEERVPFLDTKFVQFSRNIDFNHSVTVENGTYHEKAIIKNAFSNILPMDIINRKKKGYGTPTQGWFLKELSELFEERIEKSVIFRSLNREYIRDLLIEHRCEKKKQQVKLWSLFALDLWHFIFIENEARLENIEWKQYAPKFADKYKY